ncbi:MAG: TolC family protein [Rhodocyclaceae bacterium]|nr:TolC family protein [Rhodocyclaceae bacterium]
MTASRRMLLRAGALLLWALVAGSPQPALAVLGSDLPGLLEYARSHNPELAALARDADAAREQVGVADALPDPRFQLELMDFTNAASGRDASLLPGEVGVTRYRLIQALPFWGKRALRGELARSRAAQSRQAIDVGAAQIETDIKQAFARYVEADGRDRIQRDTLSLLEALEQLVLTRYAVGLVPQQDALRAQGEITRVRIDLLETGRRIAEARARLNAALPRPADAPLAEPQALPLPLALPPLAELSARARDRAPELAVLRAGAEASGVARELVVRERYPDFAVGLTNNRPRNGEDSWDLMLELNIPLQRTRRLDDERRAGYLQQAANDRVAAAEARIDGRLGELWAGVGAARARARLLEHSLLPQSRAALEAAEAGYETGTVNFDTLIEAQRRILQTRLALLESRVEAWLGVAEIERILGEAL